MTKNKTTYTAIAKKTTSYAANTSASLLLNSTTVTLASIVYRLNGYTTATAPNQLSTKPATAYS